MLFLIILTVTLKLPKGNDYFLLYLWAICSFALLCWANPSHSLICHEPSERFAHSCSLVMSDLSKSLTFAHMPWAIWAIRSQSLTCPEWPERFTHGRSFVLSDLSEWAMSKWANSQPCISSTGAPLSKSVTLHKLHWCSSVYKCDLT